MFLLYYFFELNFRIIYIFISFIICISVSFLYFESILLLEIYPVIKGLFGNFIIIHITEVFDIIYLSILSMSCFCIMPLFIYQFYCFFNIGWYFYQIQFVKKNLFIYNSFIIILLFFYYYSILPNTLFFFTQWSFFKKISFFLNIEIDFNVFLYITWVLKLRYNFIVLLLGILLLSVHLGLFYPVWLFYILIKFYRKQLFFLSVTIIYFIIPPDIFLQIILILFLIIIYEVIFFLICYKFVNFNDNNYAYN
uniref:SecY n=1 Tax=Plocamiocolax pulvinatus TaxID=35206 RepID=E5Q3H0_9FLOR|nr:SecY [Plocamiocolax pulvinata]ADR03253.1 SecY [Plocamiocolax pulvinata]